MAPASPQAAGGQIRKLDHIIYATPDLNLGIDKLEEALGYLSVQAGPRSVPTRPCGVALTEIRHVDLQGK